MAQKNYANAYKEVLVIINMLIKKDYDKIPKEYIDFLQDNCNNEHVFEYDNSKSLEEQKLLDDTKYILFGLFEKFGATEKQKGAINAFRTAYNNRVEFEKRKKYNPDNIFNNAPKRDPFEENGISYKKKNNFMTGGDINEKNAGVVLEAINKTSEEIEKNKQDSNNEMGIKKSENGFLGKLVVFFKNIFGNK